jgi:mercuric ion transport protein
VELLCHRVIGHLPSLLASLCWLLIIFGLGVLLSKNFLVPMSIALWGLALASLAFRARARRGYGPLSVGVVAVSIVLVGKFVPSSHSLLYLGLLVLMRVSLWNSWPQDAAASGSCVRCASREPAGKQ